MNKQTIAKNIKYCSFRNNEDIPVLDFFDTLDTEKNYRLLEVGSGMCRFVDKINILYPNIKITCVEINSDLADLAKEKGYQVFNENFLKNSLNAEDFDIVHCSHVIEHFKYPEIIHFLDELLRVTKINSYCIIRSPLMWEGFFSDIDHVRPYPPAAITNYLNNEQQQKKGKNTIKIERLWYRTSAKQYNHIDKTSLLYALPFRRFINKRIDGINRRFVALWEKYRFPTSAANGYVMIMKRLT